MAEQAINTIYGLGDQPDALCSEIIRIMTVRVFSPPPSVAIVAIVAEDIELPDAEVAVEDVEMMDGDKAEEDVEGEGLVKDEEFRRSPSSAPSLSDPLIANAFELSQVIFVAGHCAIKQLVHLELVERDVKRRKVEEDKKLAEKPGGKAPGQDELDQVAGSVEDEVGDVIAHAKEHELLYGPESLLAVFGPLAAQIVSQPKLYRVRSFSFFFYDVMM